MKVQNKVIVVTGGGSGIGREIALKLVTKGAKVAMADINKEGMEETMKLAGKLANNISAHYLDISNQEKVEEFPNTVIKAHNHVDGIINNAGIIQPFISVNELGYDKIERIMNINFYGTLFMVKSFLPHLLKRPEAHIANVSSMGGFMPFPRQTIYGASKAAVKVLTEGLYAELSDTNVGVSVIYPGAINTNIMSNSGVKLKAEEATLKNSKENNRAMEPSKAANLIINAIEENKFRVIVGSDARLLDILYRLNPRRAINFIVKKMGDIH